MDSFYDRYVQGYHQEVYDELQAMGHHLYEDHPYEDVLAVAREIMRRVRSNIEILIARLSTLGYQFGKGFWEDFDDLSPQERAIIKQDIPVFRAPSSQTAKSVAELARLVGPLPLSLKCWYEEVGCVNLVGSFPSFDAKDFRGGPYGLDPLFVYSVD